MLVYGDRSRVVATADLLAAIADALSDAVRGRAPWARHDAICRALIHAGELAQGVADDEFERRGRDDVSEVQFATMSLATAIARRWLGPDPSSVAMMGLSPEAALSALRDRALPARIVCKSPEGFDFYAVYPENYVALGVGLRGSDPLVIGLRSIGTTLAAAVAAGAGAATPITLRPVGEPFARTLALSPALRRRLAAHRGVFLVVDEGPGLSGSSFGAVGDLLESLGVDHGRIVYLPSHHGEPGAKASPDHRARWRRARRGVRTLDDLLAAEPLGTWFADLIGPVRSLDDLSGGAWRDGLPTIRRPPGWTAQERRKFRLTTASGVYLARFAGLGARGAAKFTTATRLHEAGFVPKPLALRRGFLLERWIPTVSFNAGRPDRAAFLDHLARYLRFRSLNLTSEEDGADLDTLITMTLVNARLLDGGGLARRLEGLCMGLRCRTPLLRPIWGDGRLHHWEWLRAAGGAWVKTDALDHAVAHDLVGCQDVAWDVAGAAVEFRLSQAETASLARAAGADPAALPAFSAFYLAFQAAHWTMAETSAAPCDLPRIQRLRDRRVGDLRALAAEAPPAYLPRGS